tara:strand:+ start:8969 stop:9196 length:228 start_codon:yes stop_codon:yes gene_type:complete
MNSPVSSYKAPEVFRLSSSFSSSEDSGLKNEMKGDELQKFRQMSLDNLSSSLVADQKARDEKREIITKDIMRLYK